MYETKIKELQKQHNVYWIGIVHLLDKKTRTENESERNKIKRTLLIQDNIICKYRKENGIIKQYIHAF
jgi:hypothetical protein